MQGQVRPAHHVEAEEAESNDGLFEEAVRHLQHVAEEEEALLDLREPHTIGRAAEEQSEPETRQMYVRAVRAITDAERLQHQVDAREYRP